MKRLCVYFDQSKFPSPKAMERFDNVIYYYIGQQFLEILKEHTREFIRIDVIIRILEEK